MYRIVYCDILDLFSLAWSMDIVYIVHIMNAAFRPLNCELCEYLCVCVVDLCGSPLYDEPTLDKVTRYMLCLCERPIRLIHFGILNVRDMLEMFLFLDSSL